MDNTYGIYLARTDGCRIDRNLVSGNAENEVGGGNGLHLWNANNIQMRHNTVRRHRDGFYFEFAGGLDIRDNASLENIRYGMHFMFSSGNEFHHNRFSDNGTGVALMYSKELKMTGNIFSDNWGQAVYGLLAKNINDSDISGNLFRKNTVAIFMDESNRNSFRDNDFLDNGYAARVLGNCEENSFSGNNFINNFFEISTNSRDSLNSFRDNYWSGARRFDLDRDGYGDTPYRPVRVFGYWIARYPALVVLLRSPVVDFLELAEKAFPVITPASLFDTRPRMNPWERSRGDLPANSDR